MVTAIQFMLANEMFFLTLLTAPPQPPPPPLAYQEGQFIPKSIKAGLPYQGFSDHSRNFAHINST